MVKYCNAACKKKHRSKHKKQCERRVAELHDEALFKEPPPPEECPICFLPLPLDSSESFFKLCCGKLICDGCIVAIEEEAYGRSKTSLCAFCREPTSNSEEEDIKRMKKLMEAGNADAFLNFAGCYARGIKGMPQDWSKANELLLKAGELGCAVAYSKLGNSYYDGSVEVDTKKATHYWELAAITGNVHARHNLGHMEYQAGNYHRAYKHFILSARAGEKDSLEEEEVKEGFMQGMVTKDEFANTLRVNQKIQDSFSF
jgi:hypothetical protein